MWTRFRLGLFDPAEKNPYSKYTIKDNDTPEHQQVALELARQSLVLLKNDGILPLNRSKIKRDRRHRTECEIRRPCCTAITTAQRRTRFPS